MDLVKIDGVVFDVAVTEIEENFNILYSENTGRTIAPGARMSLDPLGTFYGHKITLSRKNGSEEDFDRLFDFVSRPRSDGVLVEIVHNQTTIAYDAYISNGSRTVDRVNKTSGAVFWGALSLNIVPMEAQVLPDE